MPVSPTLSDADLLAEIERLRRELADAQSQIHASERLAEIGTLTGGLAHEIKNPLSTVQLNLQLLAEDVDPSWPGSGRVLNRLKTVQRETGRLREILDDFLRYAGKLEVEFKPVALRAVLQDLADFFEPQAAVSKVRLHLKPGTDLTVRADERLLKQTVLNLMLNAVQAMPNGGELMLSAEAVGYDAVVHVIDTGMGISPEARTKIFQAYYTTKKGGTGLGLAMARRIIQAHHGELGVTSDVGKGSDFWIRLPLD